MGFRRVLFRSPEQRPAIFGMRIDENARRRRDDADMDQPGLEAEIEKIIELPLLGPSDGTKPFEIHFGPPPAVPSSRFLSPADGGVMSRNGRGDRKRGGMGKSVSGREDLG